MPLARGSSALPSVLCLQVFQMIEVSVKGAVDLKNSKYLIFVCSVTCLQAGIQLSGAVYKFTMRYTSFYSCFVIEYLSISLA